jgi:hypothetical protein
MHLFLVLNRNEARESVSSGSVMKNPADFAFFSKRLNSD